MQQAEPPTQEPEGSETTVSVRCTGHVRTEVGKPRFEYTFEGATLREFLDAFCAEYDVREGSMFQTSQWSHTFPAGSTASGSSITSTSDSAPSGTPDIDSGWLRF